MQVKHAYPAETDPTTQMGALQEQRAPAKASETQLRKPVSSSLGPSSGLTWTCSSTYLSIAIRKPSLCSPHPCLADLGCFMRVAHRNAPDYGIYGLLDFWQIFGKTVF
jgi:hypothetical protein